MQVKKRDCNLRFELHFLLFLLSTLPTLFLVSFLDIADRHLSTRRPCLNDGQQTERKHSVNDSNRSTDKCVCVFSG